MTRKVGALAALLFVLGLPASASAQITVPNTLTAGAVIRAADLNTNFSALGDKALNRITGGIIEGNVTLTANVTFDGVDISDFLLTTGEVMAQGAGSAASPAFSRVGDTNTGLYFPAADEIALTLGGTQRLLLNASGLTVFGVNIINGSGKLPALTSTYLADLSGAALTALNASELGSGTVPLARLANIANAQIAAAAGIAYTKLNLSSSIVDADISGAASINWSKVSKAGSSLADLGTRSASDLASGTLADARVAQSNVTQHQAALSIAGSQLTGTIAQARLGNVLGAWTTAAVDTVIQAATDLLVVAAPDNSTNYNVKTDGSNPPTTSRGVATGANGGVITVPVRKNDYYKVESSGGGGGTIYVIPIGG